MPTPSLKKLASAWPRQRKDRGDLRAANEQLRVAVNGMRWGMLGSAVGVLIMSLNLEFEQQSATGHTVWTWCCAALCINLAGLAAAYRFRQRDAGEPTRTPHAHWTLASAAAAGAAWGLPPWLLLPSNSDSVWAVLFISNSLVLMAGGAALAVYRPLLYAFVLPLTGLFVSGLWVTHVFIAPIASFVTLSFLTILFARTQERALRVAILLRFEKEALIAEVTAQHMAAEEARAKADRAMAEAETANQAKTAFLAAAGHDLRQPMHALIQYFDHLKRRNKDPELDQTVIRIGKSLDAMQDLLDSVLEVSKLMTGSVKARPTSFPVAKLFDRIDVQMRPLAEQKGLRFRVDGPAAWVHTDEILLERVLRNLTLNAIRYTDSGGVHIRARPRGKRIAIQVFDTGIGIAKSERQRIFEAFYQVGNSARNRSKGLGLGLAIAKQLADLLGLRLGLRSRLGRGSIFSVEIETCESSPDLFKEKQRGGLDFAHGAFAVVIDDNEESLAATAASLTSFGCKVLAANSGLQAIERLQGQEFMPDLIVSDYRLEEGETGLDAIRMVIDNQKALLGDEFSIAALLISGDTAPNELELVRLAGFRMLHKPVRVDDLYEAVNEALTRIAMPNDDASTIAL